MGNNNLKHEKISISLPSDQIEEIDKARNLVSRSAFFSKMIENCKCSLNSNEDGAS